MLYADSAFGLYMPSIYQISGDDVLATQAALRRPHLFIGCLRDDTTLRTELTWASDPALRVPTTIPRPSTGYYLGMVKDAVTEDPGIDFEFRIENLNNAATSAVYRPSQTLIACTLLFSGDIDVEKFLRPTGIRSPVDFKWGGASTPTEHCLVIVFDDDLHPDYWRIHLYHRVVLKPTPLVNGQVPTELQFEAYALVGTDAAGCDLAAGIQIANEWWVDRDLNLVDPRTIAPASPTSGYESYAPLKMVGGMIG